MRLVKVRTSGLASQRQIRVNQRHSDEGVAKKSSGIHPPLQVVSTMFVDKSASPSEPFLKSDHTHR